MNIYCISNSIEEFMKRGSECEFTPEEESLKNEWEYLTTYRGTTKRVLEEWKNSHAYEAGEMAMAMTSMSASFNNEKFTLVRKQTCGSRVDISRYLAGDERCWFSMRRKPREVQAIRVYAPIGGVGNVSKEEMLVCGALAASVVEHLESNGVAVELWAACAVEDYFSNDDRLCELIKIKDSSEYSDLGMIAYICGNELVYRNIMWKERVAFARDMKRNGMNGSINCDPGCYYSTSFEVSDLMPDERESGKAIVIPRIYNVESAKAWLEKNFKEEQQ